jgi:hypothetical protein
VQDLQIMIDRMKTTPGWVPNIFHADNIEDAKAQNVEIASNQLNKVLLSRWVIFHTFIEVAVEHNNGKLPDTIKHDWLLFQVFPRIFDDSEMAHPFIALMNECLVGAPNTVLAGMLEQFSPMEILPAFNFMNTFYYVLDEAQVAGDEERGHMGAFADAKSVYPCSVLRPIVQAWTVPRSWSQDLKIIISGTGFSLSPFESLLHSSSVGKRPLWDVESMTGDFTDQERQKLYTTRYLPPTFLHSSSGTALLTRMFQWLRGR